ncbi:nucleotidyltransferase family protein [Candidatus Trichorickettsia mobilis]|uniref:nucleotidyltransferase family protein n=1 Tax=Candidatus Trichorickettsia mobilis TaxID=1346319 RepID=UPI0029305086|nr:nucleotidyltransferase domain-containing protein [Candidatus Trichorickettsia mobilis]
MIYLDPEDLMILKSILQKYPYTFYAYGSRVKGTHRKFSDLDLCIIEDVDDRAAIFELKEELEESNLSIKVDIKRYWHDMNDDFRSLIQKDLVLVQTK